MSDELVSSDPSYCPDAYGVFSKDRHGAQYACPATHTYRNATFVWEGPHPELSSLMRRLQDAGPTRVAFVGDSTVQQVFYAFACEMERAGALDARNWRVSGEGYAKLEAIDQGDGAALSTRFWFSRFLRSDLPCAPRCTNATIEVCEACTSDGAPRAVELDAMLLDALSWRPDALFLGVGSWYNYHKGLYDSDVSFHRTLHVLRERLDAQPAAVPTFWYDIPSCGAACDRAKRPEPAYEWVGIAAKNAMACRVLGGAVHLLNASEAVQPRLAADRVWPDGGPTDGMPHYCNPGPSSIPRFVVHAFLLQLDGERSAPSTRYMPR